MSARFGRNQRRQLRADIERAEREAERWASMAHENARERSRLAERLRNCIEVRTTVTTDFENRNAVCGAEAVYREISVRSHVRVDEKQLMLEAMSRHRSGLYEAIASALTESLIHGGR